MQKTHKDRVELAIYEARQRFVLQDLQDRIAHDVAKIEERLNVLGLEISYFNVMDCTDDIGLRTFTVEFQLDGQSMYTFQYDGKMDDRHWPIQAKWGPYLDPVEQNDWCLIKSYVGEVSVGLRFLAQDCSLNQALIEFKKVRNFVL